MFVTIFCIALTLASGSFASTLTSHPLNLKARLEDHSWNHGLSSLVAVGADSTCNAIFSCADCNTAQICRPTAGGGFTPVTKVSCPADRPFCDYSTGSCTTEPDVSCGQTDDFICLKEQGHFPDPNCTQYHVCNNYVSHKFECKIAGQNYNADDEKCEDATQCATFDCDGSGKKVASSLYQSYFSYCEPGTPGQPGVIDRCDGINQLNATSQLCEPICSSEGVLQDVEDCTKYYRCSYLYITDSTKFLIRERLNCPENTGFDPSNFICVSLSEIPECQAPTSPPSTTTTPAPVTQSTTAAPTSQPTTATPTTQPTTTAPTTPATTATPTTQPTTAAPSTTIAPTAATTETPTTRKP